MTIIIALICFLVRVFLIPNPFYYIAHETNLTIGNLSLYMHPITLNILAEPVILGLTFAIIHGLYGRGGDRLVEGILYFACYALLAALIYFGTTGYISWTKAL